VVLGGPKRGANGSSSSESESPRGARAASGYGVGRSSDPRRADAEDLEMEGRALKGSEAQESIGQRAGGNARGWLRTRRWSKALRWAVRPGDQSAFARRGGRRQRNHERATASVTRCG